MGLLDPQALEYFGLLGQSMLAGQSPNAGVNIGNAMMYADTEMRRKAAEKARLEEERQQAKMRDMAMQKALQDQEAQRRQGEAQARAMASRPDLADRFTLDPQGAIKQMFPDQPQPKYQFAPNGQIVDMSRPDTTQNYGKMPDWKDPEWVKTQMGIRAAGRPVVNATTNVLPPRERFKDSITLKKDFDAQPEVKGFKEVQGAWDQISTALQKPSPANDMAAATKFMKLLDPGSVVRESELMMAMQASGALDRFANTADRILRGHKLTPQQRKDFYEAGQALFNASKDRYSQTVQQYEGIAKQYELDGQFIQNAKPRTSSGWSIQKVGD